MTKVGVAVASAVCFCIGMLGVHAQEAGSTKKPLLRFSGEPIPRSDHDSFTEAFDFTPGPGPNEKNARFKSDS
jgi:hypothetical protein